MRPDRFTIAWLAILTATAVVLCFTPLFDLLGFEFGFAIAIPLSMYGGACGVRARRLTGPLRAWGVAARRVLVAALLPLALITANAVRVQNCDYLEGLAFYALIPITGAIVAAGWGVALARLAPRRGVVLFALALVGTVLAALARFWLDPPVDLFHPFFGYWPGALYDDIIHIDGRLLWSRLEDLAFAALLVTASRLDRSRRPRPLLVAMLATLAAIGARLGATHHAVHRDADWIAAELGGLTETEHLRIVHPADWRPAEVARLADELEFAYHELRAFFDFDLSRPATVWLYPDETTKKRLMGARRVRIAKPWQWAFHVHAPAVGQDVLIHELAHVFSAEIAPGPHHLSLYRGLVPHMPIIEGLAEAATWKADRLDLHQWTAAMQRIHVAPPLDAVLAPTGFYLRNSRTAYTLTGSFTRYFRDRRGPAALAEAYRRGTFELPDGPPLDALIADWRAFVEAEALPDGALEHARARFDRPAIFGRACAHEIAALRAAAAEVGPADALAYIERILRHLPGDLSARLARIGLLLRLGRIDAARVAALDVADDPAAGEVARARARERLADIDALAGRAADARAGYDAALSAAFERADLRRLWIKRATLDAGPAGDAALRYLALPTDGDRTRRLAAVEAIAALAPDWPVARYLRARARLAADRPVEALTDLAAAADLPDPSLRLEIERMAADALFGADCFARAAVRYRRLATAPQASRGEVLDLQRWARRAAFFADRRGPAPAACAEIDIAARALDDATRPAE